MNSQELRALQEAYSQVYAPQEVEEDVQDAVKGALEKGAKFMKTNPVAKAVGAVIAPAGSGRKTPTATSDGYRKEEVEQVDEKINLKTQSSKRKSLGKGYNGEYESPKEFRKTEIKDAPYQSKGNYNAHLSKEETDLYDIILSHLLDEGYADTEQAAEAIMVNMSEDWREDIVEKHATFGYNADDPGDDFDQFVQKGPKTNKQKRQAIELNKKILSKKKN